MTKPNMPYRYMRDKQRSLIKVSFERAGLILFRESSLATSSTPEGRHLCVVHLARRTMVAQRSDVLPVRSSDEDVATTGFGCCRRRRRWLCVIRFCCVLLGQRYHQLADGLLILRRRSIFILPATSSPCGQSSGSVFILRSASWHHLHPAVSQLVPSSPCGQPAGSVFTMRGCD